MKAYPTTRWDGISFLFSLRNCGLLGSPNAAMNATLSDFEPSNCFSSSVILVLNDCPWAINFSCLLSLPAPALVPFANDFGASATGATPAVPAVFTSDNAIMHSSLNIINYF